MIRWICFLMFAGFGAEAQAGELPVIPVGLDAYRQWDQWPMQRIGARAYMRSTYDRSGGNETADAAHFLYGEGDEFHVTLDEEGPGILYFARYNHWHGSPWHYEVDGVDHIVQETSSADPTNPVEGSIFLPEAQFPNPLTWTWSITKGADLMWVPIPFEESFRMAYSRTKYGTGYYIFHRYVPGIPLSQPIQSWDETSTPGEDVLDLLARAGTDIAPKDIETLEGAVQLDKSGGLEICALSGPATIRALKFSVPRDSALDFGSARLRVTWDGRPKASIDAPVSLFFGAGVLYNRDDREYLVKALPVNIRYDEDRVHLACYLPMPFFDSAVVEIADIPDACKGEISYEVRHEPYAGPAAHVGYLHATYRDHPEPKPGHDLELLDTAGVEGEEVWSGSFIGTSFIFSHDAVLNTLEGDPRFFIDDCQTPNYGTGTEEWGGGGDYWGGRNMTLPLAGHPVGAKNADEALDDYDKIQSAYRFLLADLMPFGRRAVIRLEHGGVNQTKEHYETVTYWYGLPAASLVKTDELEVGNNGDEERHGYDSPDASQPVEIVSRYEWGIDTFHPNAEAGPLADADRAVEVYPAHTETGRTTTGTSEFTMRLRADNEGVLLRRTLDYSYPNQRARVYVADPASDGELNWEYAGIWYEAGSNTCYHSAPPGELDPPKPKVQTSNRRFRDDEFLVPRDLARGRDSIRVRVEFTPVPRPLMPGMDVPELAWSELRYEANCFVLPDWKPVSR
jgi:hypothetical protein